MSSVNIKMKGDKSKEIKQLAGILKGEINAELVCDSRRSLEIGRASCRERVWLRV